jgi:hypothetical protein
VEKVRQKTLNRLFREDPPDMDTFDASTGKPVGENSTANPPASPPIVDLTPVRLGTATFSNPCFWILVGVVGTITAQWLLGSQRTRRDN